MSRKVLIRNLEDSRTERSVFVAGVEIRPGRELEIDVAGMTTIGSDPSFKFKVSDKEAEHARRNAEQRALASRHLQEKMGLGPLDGEPVIPQQLDKAEPRDELIWQSREAFEALSMQELRAIAAPYEISNRSKAGLIDEIVAWQEKNATAVAGEG